MDEDAHFESRAMQSTIYLDALDEIEDICMGDVGAGWSREKLLDYIGEIIMDAKEWGSTAITGPVSKDKARSAYWEWKRRARRREKSLKIRA